MFAIKAGFALAVKARDGQTPAYFTNNVVEMEEQVYVNENFRLPHSFQSVLRRNLMFEGEADSTLTYFCLRRRKKVPSH
jgi:hypothetical protein